MKTHLLQLLRMLATLAAAWGFLWGMAAALLRGQAVAAVTVLLCGALLVLLLGKE